jgi:hypothetical protein
VIRAKRADSEVVTPKFTSDNYTPARDIDITVLE